MPIPEPTPPAMTMILPNVGPWRFLAFAGAALALPGGTVAEVGAMAGLTNPAHRRRVAQALVQGGLCRLHATAWGGAGGTGTALHVHDHGRVSPTFDLAGLDAVVGAGHLDQADRAMRKLPCYEAAKRMLARLVRVDIGELPSSQAYSDEYGANASASDVRHSLMLPVAMGQAWVVGNEVIDGGSDMPADIPGAFARAVSAALSDGEATASEVLRRLCVSHGVAPGRMQSALSALPAEAWTPWDLSDDIDLGPVRGIEVVSGNLGGLRGLIVPLDRLDLGGRSVSVVRPARRHWHVVRSVAGHADGRSMRTPALASKGRKASPATRDEPWRRRWNDSVPRMPAAPEAFIALTESLAGTTGIEAGLAQPVDDDAWEALRRMGLVGADHGHLVPTHGVAMMAEMVRQGRLAAAAEALRTSFPELDATLHALEARDRVRPGHVRELATLSVSAFGQPRHWPVAKACLGYAMLFGAAWADGSHIRHGSGGRNVRLAAARSLARTMVGGVAPVSSFLPEFCRRAGFSPVRVAEMLRTMAPEDVFPGCRLVPGERHAVPGGGGKETGRHVASTFESVPATRLSVGGRDISHVVPSGMAPALAGVWLAVVVEADAHGVEAVADLVKNGVRMDGSAPFDPDDEEAVRRECSALRDAMLSGSRAYRTGSASD